MTLPPNACDTHFHIFGLAGDYQFASRRTYTPPPATVPDYRALMARLGFARAVIVQPTVYGFDHSCTLAGMAALGPGCRGVAVIGPAHDEAAIERLHQAGMRGTRVALSISNAPRPPGAPPLASLPELAARVRPFGWHLQFILDGRTLPEVRPHLARLGVPLVIDHMGAFGGHADPTREPGLAVLLDLLADGAWVKLSAPYHMDGTLARPWWPELIGRLHGAAPDRVMWGTNWPHPMQEAPPAEERWIELLRRCLPDEADQARLFSTNAARLYGWA